MGDAHNGSSQIGGLNDRFWVWETLEEATRPHIDTLNNEEIGSFMQAWALNFKGSDDLNDLVIERYLQLNVKSPFA